MMHRAQQREDHREEEPERAGAIEHGGLVELARDGRDEGAEQQDAERQPEGRLDQDQPGHGLEEPETLQHPDRRHDRRRHDQAGQHEEADDPLERGRLRCRTYPTIAARTTMMATLDRR